MKTCRLFDLIAGIWADQVPIHGYQKYLRLVQVSIDCHSNGYVLLSELLNVRPLLAERCEILSILGRQMIDEEDKKMLMFILTIVLVMALVGSLPTWPHSRGWGYYPSGGLSLVLVVLLILLVLGRL